MISIRNASESPSHYSRINPNRGRIPPRLCATWRTAIAKQEPPVLTRHPDRESTARPPPQRPVWIVPKRIERVLFITVHLWKSTCPPLCEFARVHGCSSLVRVFLSLLDGDCARNTAARRPFAARRPGTAPRRDLSVWCHGLRLLHSVGLRSVDGAARTRCSRPASSQLALASSTG
jgi:hypothetical protein